jgi:hypothetical protein
MQPKQYWQPKRHRETSVTDKDHIPSAALWLGVAGLIPFVGCATEIALGWPLPPKFIGPALYAIQLYGAVILSFMGGVQWGLAVHDIISDTTHGSAWRRYGISVLPAFAAWAGLWVGGRNGLLTVAAGLALLLAYDMWTVARGEAPAWYARLRAGLTAVAVTTLVIASVFLPF